jgi:TP901 family phage tail tape measure protein
MLTTGLSAPLGIVGAAAIKTASDFEFAMDRVKAASKASDIQMKSLSQTAKDIAKISLFSPEDVANIERELAKAGIAVTDIVNGAARAVADLAQATDAAPEEAANVLARSLSVFKASGNDAREFADIITAVANETVLEVHDVGEALKMAGGMAHFQGWSFRELGAYVASASENMGQFGSDLGTTLKVFQMFASGKSKQSKELIQELGLEMFYKKGPKKGQMKGFVDMAKELKRVLGPMESDMEKLGDVGRQIFGTDATRGMLNFLTLGEDGAEAWMRKMTQMELAAKQAAEKTDNMHGAFERFGEGIKTAMIAWVEPYQGKIKEITDSMGSWVHHVEALPKPLRDLASSLGAVAIMVGPILLLTAALTAFGSILLNPLRAVAFGASVLGGGALMQHFTGLDFGSLWSDAKSILQDPDKAVKDLQNKLNQDTSKAFDEALGEWKYTASGEDPGGKYSLHVAEEWEKHMPFSSKAVRANIGRLSGPQRDWFEANFPLLSGRDSIQKFFSENDFDAVKWASKHHRKVRKQINDETYRFLKSSGQYDQLTDRQRENLVQDIYHSFYGVPTPPRIEDNPIVQWLSQAWKGAVGWWNGTQESDTTGLDLENPFLASMNKQGEFDKKFTPGTAWADIWGDAINLGTEMWDALMAGDYKGAAQKLAPFLIEVINAGFDSIVKVWKDNKQKVKDLLGDVLGGVVMGIWTQLKEDPGGTAAALGTVFGMHMAWGIIKGLFNRFTAAIAFFGGVLIKAWKAGKTAIKETIIGAFMAAWKWLKGVLGFGNVGKHGSGSSKVPGKGVGIGSRILGFMANPAAATALMFADFIEIFDPPPAGEGSENRNKFPYTGGLENRQFGPWLPVEDPWDSLGDMTGDAEAEFEEFGKVIKEFYESDVSSSAEGAMAMFNDMAGSIGSNTKGMYLDVDYMGAAIHDSVGSYMKWTHNTFSYWLGQMSLTAYQMATNIANSFNAGIAQMNVLGAATSGSGIMGTSGSAAGAADRAQAAGFRVSSGYRPGATVAGTNRPSLHGSRRGVDIAGNAATDGELWKFMRNEVGMAAVTGLKEAIFGSSIWSSSKGWYSYGKKDHYDHLHLGYAFQNGGLMPSTGPALLHQGEYVVPRSQVDSIKRGYGGGGGGYHLEGGIMRIIDLEQGLVEIIDGRIVSTGRAVARQEIANDLQFAEELSHWET